MGCSCSVIGGGGSEKVMTMEEKESADLERQLELDRLKANLHFKVLCLGAGESGKSTVIKMLRLIFKGKLKTQELKSYVNVLHGNTVLCMQTLVTAATRRFGYTLAPENSEAAERVLGHDINLDMPETMGTDIEQLWKDEAIQRAYDQRNQFWLLDGAKYYFDNVQRFCEYDYTPTEEDTIMARTRTTGLVLSDFDDGPVHWTIVDVGGQRSERKKWINAFDDVKAIFFVVNLAGYSTVLFEDEKKNRMEEELDVFEQVCSYPIFAKTPVFLFLNKKDLFEEVLRRVPLTYCFPDFTGGNDTQACLTYITEQFKARLKGRRLSGVHYISARFKKDVKASFDDVRHELMEANKKTVQKAVAQVEKAEKQMRRDEEKAQSS
eukprot:TRINITY_DN4617_c0_g2_i4.p1 TRINITY_DN4617_c0_g2~~TRINITY_DN4617_c0_g2_i4.p1  ORF type:complete len:379 (-),score=89.30 TRINITY_DN4617_c0_g2_i4:342-1478(-)